MTSISQRELSYVVWQNRATRFYIAARLCYLNTLYAPAAYCGVIALELMMKATLIYHDKSFVPERAGHRFAALSRTLRNKVPSLRQFEFPSYFAVEKRYIEVTRYPKANRGVLIPASFLRDLDAAFAALLSATPFQHNTELKRILRTAKSPERAALTRSNAEVRSLRAFLKVKRVRVSRNRAA